MRSFLPPVEETQAMPFSRPGRVRLTAVLQKATFVPLVFHLGLLQAPPIDTGLKYPVSAPLWHAEKRSHGGRKAANQDERRHWRGFFPAAWFMVGSALYSQLVLGKWMRLFVKWNCIELTPVQAMWVTEMAVHQPGDLLTAPSPESSLKTLVESVSIQLFNHRMLCYTELFLDEWKQPLRYLFYRNMGLEQPSLRRDAQNNSDSPTHPPWNMMVDGDVPDNITPPTTFSHMRVDSKSAFTRSN